MIRQKIILDYYEDKNDLIESFKNIAIKVGHVQVTIYLIVVIYINNSYCLFYWKNFSE